MIVSLFLSSTMPTPSLDGNFIFPRSAGPQRSVLPVRTTDTSGKWTVSPEFGDALLHAMREQSYTRIPSILELPQPKRPELLVPSRDARRLTKKTRIAVRDKTPHRFEVVPLREVQRRAPSPMFKKITPLANARVKLRTVNAENSELPPPPANSQSRPPSMKPSNVQLTVMHTKSVYPT